MTLLFVLLLLVPVAIGANFTHVAVPVTNTMKRDANSREGAFLLLVHVMLAVALFYF